MALRPTRAPTYWRVIMAVALLMGAECAASAQSLGPVQRTPEQEKQFQEWQSRSYAAEAALRACMQREVERDYGMTFMSVPTTVTHAINTCSALLERHAFVDCAMGYKDGEKYCAQSEMRAASIKVRREQQMEAWVPVLVKRRVELQSDGPKYLYDFASRFVYVVVAKNEKANTTTQGIAVAIGKRSLVTNCRAIEGATGLASIAIENGTTSIPALGSGDKGGPDRCLLLANPFKIGLLEDSRDLALPAFAKIRKWEDLSVGERVFAIGVSRGPRLDLSFTLSDGILSGKQTDAKHRLVLATAPIAGGSLGGALFDSSGRLLGMTTSTLTGGPGFTIAIAAEDWHYELCRSGPWFGPQPDCERHRPVPCQGGPHC